ncbi:MAG TPA: sigma-70 family RNA polymerase sigma factor [Bacteroidia bacterium]|nr:sigma-70 family RNA polymerase sigma factor [Bacteroidia bacterium]
MAEQTQYTAESQTKDEALSNTIKKERGKLLTFISNRTPTIEDAEDILQDVFYELVQSETIENTAAWLYRVARNKITDWYRKMKPDRLDDISFNRSDEDEALLLSDIIPSMETSADKQILLKLISEVLADTLEELPKNQREVFVLHEIEGKSLKEIAELTDTGIKTVISRKRYAVMHLQDRLKSLYTELLNN